MTTTSGEGKVTLIARYVAGTDVEATVSWTDKEKHLVLWWPADKPEPHILGSFSRRPGGPTSSQAGPLEAVPAILPASRAENLRSCP